MEDALLIIDMLNDFVHPKGALYIPGAEKIIPNVKRELDRAHQSGIPVIYVNDAHQPDDPEFKVWPKHAVIPQSMHSCEVMRLRLSPTQWLGSHPKITSLRYVN